MTYVPVGYIAPRFPALGWPLTKFTLYYTKDVVKFTMFWCIILMTAFYLAAALIASFTYYKNNKNSKKKGTALVAIVGVYVLVGVIQAVLSGSLIGLLLAEIYKSGQFGLNPWLTFIYGIIVVLFNIATSYSLTSVLL
ncbi:hypothetical protein KL909_000965 [Ogataea angusta]|nr:hypothetical protein KL909_000965 [Ogataea angusta]KAG7853414.1 hypothetical protein KL941_000464 [Ogataea angusta]KAG7863006.1 hypothetical protein KL939_000325 [Ogataea angusta]